MVAAACSYPSTHQALGSSSPVSFGKADLDRSAHVDIKVVASSREKQPRRRRVRFSTVKDVKTFACLSQCDDDLFWSTADREGFVNHARQECFQWRAAQQEHITELEAAYRHCGDKTVSKDQQREDLQAMFDWAESDGRGLERGVSPIFREEQQLVIKQIVRRYKQFLTATSGEEDSDDVAQALSAFSRRKTSVAREFAYKMGLSDAFSK